MTQTVGVLLVEKDLWLEERTILKIILRWVNSLSLFGYRGKEQKPFF
jgi:hypothetical protein